MATLAPGTAVAMKTEAWDALRYPPNFVDELAICVHPAALKSPSSLTLAAAHAGGVLTWVGAIDESSMDVVSGSGLSHVRALLFQRLLVGPRMWSIVHPGELKKPGVALSLGTVYSGDRPFVVLGELTDGTAIGAPLSSQVQGPRVYTCILETCDVSHGSRSQVELAHLWALSNVPSSSKRLLRSGEDKLRNAIENYFGPPHSLASNP